MVPPASVGFINLFKITPTVNQLQPLVVILVSVVLLLYSSFSPSFAQSPPTLDGMIDTEYFSHGHSIDCEGFHHQANATLSSFDESSIDHNYICLGWVIDKGFMGASYGTTAAPELGATNSATWMVTASSTLEDGIEVRF